MKTLTSTFTPSSKGLQSLALKDPMRVEELLQHGIDLLKTSRWSEALECFAKVIERRPDHNLVHYLEALAHYQLAHTQEAIESLQTHLKLAAHDSTAWGVLASIYHDQASYLEAKHAYTQALLDKPNDVEFLGHLGRTLQKLEDWTGAMGVYSTLLGNNPESVLAHHQLALVHQALGQIEQALLHFQLAIALDDHSVALHFDLGLLWGTQKYYQLAYLQFKRCLMLQPKHYQTHYNCGLIKHKERMWPQAIEHFDQALALLANYPECLIAKGQTLMEQKLWVLAQAMFEAVIELEADHVDAWLNLGLALKGQKKFDLAQQCFVHVLSQVPDHVLAMNNLGLLCQSMGHFELAADCFIQCQNLDASYMPACVNLAATHEKMGHYTQAIEGLQAGLERLCVASPVAVETMTRLLLRGDGLPPQLFKDLPIEWAIAQRNLGLLLLRNGEFERGWPLYDYRFHCGEDPPKYTQTQRPWFNGLKAIAGSNQLQETKNIDSPSSQGLQRLLIWAEQGVGDEIMFGSLLSEARPWAEELVVQVDARLLGLFQRSYPEIKFIARSVELDDVQFDAHLPMGSLPRILRPQLASFQKQPFCYLKADETRLLEVRAQLEKTASDHELEPLPCIGVSWRSLNESFGTQRSLSLTRLAKQLKTIYPAGVRLINLQYGDVQVDIEDCLKETGVLVEQIGSVDNFTDLDGLASLIQACDEVVSVDNSTVHLAGALGQKVTALLPLNADWRWFDNTTQSMWYPSVRLLRQASLGDWDSCWLK